MSRELFPDCPIQELPSTYQMLEEVFYEIDRLDDTVAKSRLALKIIQGEYEHIAYEIKHRTGVFEKVLGYVDAVETPEERKLAYQYLFSGIFGYVSYETCCDDILEIADQAQIHGLRDYVLSCETDYHIRDYEGAIRDIAKMQQDDPYRQELFDKIIVHEVEKGKWNLAMTRLRQLEDMNERASVLLRIISYRFLSESKTPQLITLAAELHHVLCVLLKDDRSDKKTIRKLMRELVNCYIHMDALETALDVLDDPRMGCFDFWITESLFEKMLKTRGKETAYNIFLSRCETMRKKPISKDNYGDWIECSHIADAIGMTELSHSLIEEACDFVRDNSSGQLTAEEQIRAYQQLGQHFNMPPGWNQGRKGDRSRSLEMLQLALSSAEGIVDSSIRQKSIIDVALTLAEDDFYEESLEVFRKYHTDHDFVVKFYDEIMFEIMEFYRDLTEEDNHEWGLAQRISWLKFNLYHLRQPDENAEKRISRLIYFRTDLDDLNQDLREAKRKSVP